MKNNVWILKARKIIPRFTLNAVMFIFSLSCLFPLIWMMYSALKTQQEFMMDTISLPKHLQLENFKKAIEIGQLDVAFFNSLKITTTSIILIVIIGFVTGYVLARYQFKGRNIVYSMFLAGMLVPIHGLLVPTFVEFKKLGLLDHLYALNLPYVAFGLPLAIFLTESFVKTIPVEIEEAAYMDGSSMLNTMFRIVLPICRPVMATILILSFLQKWNEFPFALVLLQSSELKTITVAIANFTGQFTVDYTRLMAALVMATGPVILLYLAAHKKVVQGMTAGAVKG